MARAALALALVACVAAAGCGTAVDRRSSSQSSSAAPWSTGAPPAGASTAPAGSGPAPPTPAAPRGSGGGGGAGGTTERVRAPALLAGHGGAISPSSVAVPPYIAVEISLTSTDGARYELAVAGKRLAVSGAGHIAVLTLPGLRPGKAYVARATTGGPPVRISASAEPGP